MKSAREHALQILRQVEVQGAYVDELLDYARSTSSLTSRDRSLLQELCLGVLRWRGRIDWVLVQFLSPKLAALTPWIRNILRLGVYQLLFMDRIPESAAVDECVKLSKRYGHIGTVRLVNGVLRTVARQKEHLVYPDAQADPVRFLSVFYSHPEWMVRRWLERYGFEETKQLCCANNRQPTVSIRVNPFRATLDELIGALREAGIVAHPHPWVPGFAQVEASEGLFDAPSFREGWFQVQDPSAALAVMLLDPQPNDRVLDVCAAPGGKTTHIAERLADRGEVVALDIHASRLKRVRQNADRLGLHIIRTIAVDARKYVADSPFDRVLVDVPCSGLGVLARRADARWRKSEAHIAELAELQYALLTKASASVKPGGVLVYSTCTIEPEENEAIVERFLRASEGCFALDATASLSPDLARDGYIRTFPHRHKMDGVFAAKFKRNL